MDPNAQLLGGTPGLGLCEAPIQRPDDFLQILARAYRLLGRVGEGAHLGNGPTQEVLWTRLGEAARLVARQAEGRPKAVLDVLLDRALELCDAERAILVLADGDTLHPVAARSQIRAVFDQVELVPFARAPVREAIAESKAVHRQGLAEHDPDESGAELDLETVLVLPLIARDVSDVDDAGQVSKAARTLGALVLDSSRPARFTEERIAVAQALADHAATALTLSELIEAHRRDVRRQRAVERAQAIQRHLLPQSAPDVPELKIAAHSRVCEDIGGDFFDFLTRGSGDITREGLVVAIGDVAGHGIGPALLMASARARLRAEMEAGRTIPEVLARLNKGLHQDMPRGMFMTFQLCALRPGSPVMFCNAGHERPIILRAKTGEIESPPLRGMALGVVRRQEFPTTTVDALEPGDVLVLLTDGFREEPDANEEELGVERVHEIIRAKVPEGPQAVVDGLIAATEAWCAPLPPSDDLTCVVIQALAAPEVSAPIATLLPGEAVPLPGEAGPLPGEAIAPLAAIPLPAPETPGASTATFIMSREDYQERLAQAAQITPPAGVTVPPPPPPPRRRRPTTRRLPGAAAPTPSESLPPASPEGSPS